MTGEMILNLLYFAVLIGLSFTVKSEVHPAEVRPSPSLSLYESPSATYPNFFFLLGCLEDGPSKNCSDGSWDPGNIVFSDSATGTGCSSALEEFKDSLDICSPELINLFKLPSCVCKPSSVLASHESVSNNSITAAYVFNSTNFRDFTIRVKSSVGTTFNPAFTPSHVPRSQKLTSTFYATNLALPVYTGLLAATSSAASGLNFSMAIQEMGTFEWEQTTAGAMTNFPMYLSVLFMAGMSTCVVELMNERQRKNDAGLIMSGVSNTSYILSWFVIAAMRQFVTIFLATG